MERKIIAKKKDCLANIRIDGFAIIRLRCGLLWEHCIYNVPKTTEENPCEQQHAMQINERIHLAAVFIAVPMVDCLHQNGLCGWLRRLL